MNSLGSHLVIHNISKQIWCIVVAIIATMAKKKGSMSHDAGDNQPDAPREVQDVLWLTDDVEILYDTSEGATGKDLTKTIIHIIMLCWSPDDSTMVKVKIEQQCWNMSLPSLLIRPRICVCREMTFCTWEVLW
jgi:hypothetical protein